MSRNRATNHLGWFLLVLGSMVASRLVVDDMTHVSMLQPVGGIGAVWVARTRSWWGRATVMVVIAIVIAVVGSLTGADVPLVRAMVDTLVVAIVVGAWLGGPMLRGEEPLVARKQLVRFGRDAVLVGIAGGVASVTTTLTFDGGSLARWMPLAIMRSALGYMLIGVLAAVLRSPRRTSRSVVTRHIAIDTLLALVVYVGAYLIPGHPPIAFATLPLTLWVARKGDLLRTFAHVGIVSLLVVALTEWGYGPFAMIDPYWQYLYVLGYCAITVVIGVGWAVGELERDAADLRAGSAERTVAALLDSSAAATLLMDRTAHGWIPTAANPAAVMLLELDDDRVHFGLADFLRERDIAGVEGMLNDASEGTDVFGPPVHVELHTRGQGVRWVEFHAHADPDSSGSVRVQLIDRTEQRELSARLVHEQTVDSLTGLGQREAFLQRLDTALEATTPRGSRIAVIALDIDHFRTVNDALGHEVGDILLAALGARLRGMTRSGQLIARMSGDSFLVMGRVRRGLVDAVALAQRLRDMAAIPFEREGTSPLRITMSAGVALSRSGFGAAELVRRADAALHIAKMNGRDRVVTYTDEMGTATRREHLLDQELREGLAHGQFVLHYQPVVDLRTRESRAVEALVRWHHPTRGLLLPGEWLDVAESRGLIVELGEWILREACRATAERLGSGGAPGVNVNVAARQLQQPGFASTVASALLSAGLSAEHLTIEVTETELLDLSGGVLDTINEIRAMGVRLSVDDFGTGYNALSTLITFPVDEIKIDRTFVAVIEEDERARAVVAGVLAIAADLGADVVAEGVETAGQAQALLAAGCSFAQGYLWGRPAAMAVA